MRLKSVPLALLFFCVFTQMHGQRAGNVGHLTKTVTPISKRVISESIYSFRWKTRLGNSMRLEPASIMNNHRHAQLVTQKHFAGKEQLTLNTLGSFYIMRNCYFVNSDSSRVVTATPIRKEYDTAMVIHYPANAELWGTKTQKKVSSLGGEEVFVGFSSNGRELFTSNNQGRLTTWDCMSGRQTGRFRGAHSKIVTSADISKDGQFLLTGSEDQTIVAWHYASRRPLQILKVSTNTMLEVKFIEEHKIVAVTIDKAGKVWESEYRFDIFAE